MAAMTDEQRDNALVFLECNTEELAGLPDGCGIQVIANVRNLLDYLHTIEPNAGGNPVRVFPKYVKGLRQIFYLSLKASPGRSKMALGFFRAQDEVCEDD